MSDMQTGKVKEHTFRNENTGNEANDVKITLDFLGTEGGGKGATAH